MRFLKQEGQPGDRRVGGELPVSSNSLLQATLRNVSWARGPSWDEAFPLGTAFTIGGILSLCAEWGQ